MELHPNEVELISIIRNRTRFGELLIVTKDGLPQRIQRTVTYMSLNVDNNTFDDDEKDAMINT